MKKYNILMVLADQHNPNQLGFIGHPQVKTPRLDEFAARSVNFSRAYASNTICTPSRISILSGQYCHNHGYYGLSGPTKPGLNNLFRHYKKQGYRTAGYGKLHLPLDPEHWLKDDLDYFGDTYDTPDGWIGKSEYFDYLTEKGLRDREDSWHNMSGYYSERTIPLDCCPSELPYEDTMEMWCASKAMEFMREDRSQPFFIQVALQRPHHPAIPQRQFWDMYPEDIDLPSTIRRRPEGRPPSFVEKWHQSQNRTWEFAEPGEEWEAGAKRHWRGTLACVTQMDDVFGKLMDFLDEQGLAEDTIVIYGSDHGGYHGIHGIEEKAPGICSDQVCRVPLIWRIPGLKGGKNCDALVENTDMAPTLTSLCGLDPMEGTDGLDITPLLRGETDHIRKAAVTENAWSKSINFDNYRLVHYGEGTFEKPFGELYDMSKDPLELDNLYFKEEFKPVVNRGKELLLDWLITTTRIVTTHPAPLAEGSRLPRRTDEPRLQKYEILPDGTAPNKNQPRNRLDGMNRFYL